MVLHLLCFVTCSIFVVSVIVRFYKCFFEQQIGGFLLIFAARLFCTVGVHPTRCKVAPFFLLLIILWGNSLNVWFVVLFLMDVGYGLFGSGI